jgi:long-subunit fatty acid transport protein
LDYKQSSSFYEDNAATLTNNYTISRLRFDNELYTYGTGFSFQLGAIAKVTNELRLGLAFESPTWYHLNDELTQKLSAVREKKPTVAGAPSDLINETVNPNVTNFYEPYKLQTPSKWTGSFAYVFGKKGLISVDYSMKDYGSTQFQPENDDVYKDLNKNINNFLANTSEWRIGGEYKIKAWSLRAGYRFEQSPYKNKVTIGDLTGYSAGLGYNFGGTKLDLAYSTSQRNTKQGFFDKGFTDGALINTRNNVFTLTVLFEL